MSSYEEVVAKDLELLWSIQEYCYRTPWLNDRMSKIISKNPLRDIVSILWIFFVMGLVELGPKHFWVVAMNMVVSFGKYLLGYFSHAYYGYQFTFVLDYLVQWRGR